MINDTHAEINLRALKKNFDFIKSKANKASKNNARVCAIVKANAYGHGMLRISEELVRYGTDYLGTADYAESVKLRDYLRKKTNG